MTTPVPGGWQGKGAESHLSLTADQYEAVKTAWQNAASRRGELDQMMRSLRDDTAVFGSNLAGDKPGVTEIDFSLKSLDSLSRKVATDLEADDAVDIAKSVGNMKDLNRYTFTFEPATYTAGTQAVFDQLEHQGFESIKKQNTWPDEVYKGINTVWAELAKNEGQPSPKGSSPIWENPENLTKDPLYRKLSGNWEPADHFESQSSSKGLTGTWSNKQTGLKVELQFHTPDSLRIKTESHKLYELARSGVFNKFGAEASKYIAATDYLTAELYKQGRQEGDKKLPIEIPAGHENLAKPITRAEIPQDLDPQILSSVRQMVVDMDNAHKFEKLGGVDPNPFANLAGSQSLGNSGGASITPVPQQGRPAESADNTKAAALTTKR